MNRTKFAAAALSAAILAAPAGAQEKKHWRDYDWGKRTPTAAEAWLWLEAKAAGARGNPWGLPLEDRPGAYGSREDRAALAGALAELVVVHAARGESAAVVLSAVRELYAAGTGRGKYMESLRRPEAMRPPHRPSLDALRRIYFALEPFPLCEYDAYDRWVPAVRTADGEIVPLPDVSPSGLPWCDVPPWESPWCLAGDALHGDEVPRAPRNVVFEPLSRPPTPPDVAGLSPGAAEWWGRCWDDRTIDYDG